MSKLYIYSLILLTLSAGISSNVKSSTLENLCESDCTNEFNFFRKYAEQGSSLAEFSLAIMYFRGQGTNVNVVTAKRYLYKAAKAGEPGAQYQLGYFLMHGLYLDKDLERARKWFKRAARKKVLDSSEKIAEIDTLLDAKMETAQSILHVHETAQQQVEINNIERITVTMHANYRQILRAAKAQTCNANCEPYWTTVLAPMITLTSS